MEKETFDDYIAKIVGLAKSSGEYGAYAMREKRATLGEARHMDNKSYEWWNEMNEIIKEFRAVIVGAPDQGSELPTPHNQEAV